MVIIFLINVGAGLMLDRKIGQTDFKESMPLFFEAFFNNSKFLGATSGSTLHPSKSMRMNGS